MSSTSTGKGFKILQQHSGGGRDRNVQVGDVILLKDPQVRRSDWPSGLVVKTVPSQDKKCAG